MRADVSSVDEHIGQAGSNCIELALRVGSLWTEA
jgi:hypothetical protein